MKKGGQAQMELACGAGRKGGGQSEDCGGDQERTGCGKDAQGRAGVRVRAVQRGNCKPLHGQHHKHGERDGKDLFGCPIYAESGGRSGGAAAGQVCHRI